jgi:murein DD-endopeptidase MepM/ murein hydrolase activator NlpD
MRFTTAAAAGIVVRAGNGAVVIDLDWDGYEQTGWVLVYMHVANSDRVQVGDYLQVDDPVGHPSCEGGSASGAHVHLARKYNGEWVLAEGGLPFVLSGYQAHNGIKFCAGTLENGERTIVADPYSNSGTITIRPESLPKYFYTPTPKNG